MGQVQVILECDGLLVVGGGLVEMAALDPKEGAVDQELVMELEIGCALELCEGLLEIRLGFVELELGRGVQLGLQARTAFDEHEILVADLAAGEAAEEIEQGMVRVGLEAGIQARLRRVGAGRSEKAVGQHAVGPEVVGVLPQGDLEVLDRIGQPLALEVFLPGQEIIEGGLVADALGQTELVGFTGPIVLLRQEGRLPQVVGA